MKINRKNIKFITDDLNKKLKDNFITNIFLLNSTDIVFAFSFYRDEKLLISLNHQNPFVSLVNKTIVSPTIINKTNEFLRKEIKNAAIVNIDQFNNDRIILIKLINRDEFYEKHQFNMYVELIPHRANLIVTDEKDIVLFATTYTTMESDRHIIKGFPYEKLEVANDKTFEDEFNLEEYKKEANNYIDTSISVRKKEKYKSLYTHIKGKVNSLNRKIKELQKEINDAKEAEINKEIGQTIYSYMSLEDQSILEEYIKTLNNYDCTLSPSDNAQKYFKKYKKATRSIDIIQEQIKLAEQSLIEKQMILDTYDYLSEDELMDLNEKYMKVKRKGKPIPAIIPSYIIVDNIKIAFGKNAKQNEYLTFKLAHKDHYYLHIANYHGSHVIIMDANPSNKVITIAAEVALLLSNKVAGEIYITQVKNIKKGSTSGEALLSRQKSIILNKISQNTKDLLINSKRYL